MPTDSVTPTMRLSGIGALIFFALAVCVALYFADTPVTVWVDGLIG